MNIINLILSSVALLVSVANFFVIRQMLKEQRASQSPDMQTKGAGGGGRR